MGLSLKRGLVLGLVACLGLALSATGVLAAGTDVSPETVVTFGSMFDSVGTTVGTALTSAFGVGAGVMVAFLIWRVIKRAGGSI